MFSLNLTVHNKGFLVREVIERIYQYTIGSFELVIVLDGCTDDSEAIVKRVTANKGNCKVLWAPDVNETKANNLAARNSEGDYIVIVQDDMCVNEAGWNERLLKPILHFSDIFAVTARTAHNWEYNPGSVHEFAEDRDDCWCDLLIHTDHADRRNIPRNVFAVRDCVNRGPLLIRHDVLQKLGYFDEIFSPQQMDDHDLCYRAREELGLRCGSYWIDYLSNLEWGGTRTTGGTAKWALKANHKNVKIVWNRHRNAILSKKNNEDRQLA